MKIILLVLALLPFLASCDQTEEAANKEPKIVEQSDPVPPQPPKERLDDWAGQWNGPEGTYLKIEQSGDGYSIKIKDLDAEKSYLGVVDGLRIRFFRDDHDAYISAARGRDIGMKWLADKSDCLMIKTGEGYCRD